MSRPRNPGDVAVERGLAERDPDGSVTFRTPEPTAPAAPATAPAAPPVDLDELARRLYGPLRAQLHAELRLDRERTGLVTDLWR